MKWIYTLVACATEQGRFDIFNLISFIDPVSIKNIYYRQQLRIYIKYMFALRTNFSLDEIFSAV